MNAPLFRADLHCHSTCSDGSLTPKQLLDLSLQKGLQALSITDHDTVEAYQEALPEAKRLGIRLLPGVEFSCEHRSLSIHILAYSFDPFHPLLVDFCHKHKERRLTRCQKILEKLAQGGVHIDSKELFAKMASNTTIGRPHIAQEMVNKGIVPNIQQAFARYLGEGCKAYIPSSSSSVEETLDLIHQAGGLAVLAHPILIKKSKVFAELLTLDLDGLEGFYANFSADQERPFIEKGEKRGLLITGGSDFHGNAKPQIQLGCSWTPQETFEKLWHHYQQQLTIQPS